jgi:hypothetical protein
MIGGWRGPGGCRQRRKKTRNCRAKDFRQALAAGATDWFSAGWWLAGPFNAGDEEPGVRRDPHGPLPPLPDRNNRAWLPAAPTADGYLDLRSSLPAGASCAYAVSRIWSPAEQQVIARLEASGAVRFWLNGRLNHETAQGHSPGQSDEVGLVLPAGWSTLAFRVAAGGTGHGLQAGPQWWTTTHPEARAAASGTGHGLQVWLSGEAERATGLHEVSK